MEVEDIKVQSRKWNVGGDCCDKSVELALRLQKMDIIRKLGKIPFCKIVKDYNYFGAPENGIDIDDEIMNEIKKVLATQLLSQEKKDV